MRSYTRTFRENLNKTLQLILQAMMMMMMMTTMTTMAVPVTHGLWILSRDTPKYYIT
jgi:hypothetical protein